MANWGGWALKGRRATATIFRWQFAARRFASRQLSSGPAACPRTARRGRHALGNCGLPIQFIHAGEGLAGHVDDIPRLNGFNTHSENYQPITSHLTNAVYTAQLDQGSWNSAATWTFKGR